MSEILQAGLPAIPWLDLRLARLPGMLPLDPSEWLLADEAFAAQMAERDRLIAARPAEVHALLPGAAAAAGELLDRVLGLLPGLGHRVGEVEVLRPDGVAVPIDRARPLLTLGRLVQEDLCLLEPGGAGEHVLTGAILCFPASWTLAEKLGRPLTRIHAPVPRYDEAIARRVQRLFDALHPDRPLWRMNHLRYAAPDLFQPRREGDPRPPTARPAPYLRAERQCLVRLPVSGAVVFSIHTYVVRTDDLPAAARAALEAAGGAVAT
jgi:hypothetical protein